VQRPSQGGGKDSGRYRKQAAASQATVTQIGRLVEKRPLQLQEAGGSNRKAAVHKEGGVEEAAVTESGRQLRRPLQKAGGS
jgi:hypothetical protein